MACHYGKISCPVWDKHVLGLSRTPQTCSAITQNEKLIDEIFYGELISFKIAMNKTKKVSFYNLGTLKNKYLTKWGSGLM